MRYKYTADEYSRMQHALLLTQLFMIGLGGCVFGLGVALRPILRITKMESFEFVRGICDMWVSVGLWQIFSAGLNILASCWKLPWPFYLAIGLHCLIRIMEMVALSTSIYMISKVDDLADELIYRSWYLWECSYQGSCVRAMEYYFYYYVCPQIALMAVAIFLQVVVTGHLLYLVKWVNNKRAKLFKNKDEMLQSFSHHSFDSIDTIIKKRELEEAAGDMNKPSTSAKGMSTFCVYDPTSQVNNSYAEEASIVPPANYSTPNSILKGDHGYVLASNSSLNFDEHYAVIPPTPPPVPQISFNANVEVHYFEELETVVRPTRFCSSDEEADVAVVVEDLNNNIEVISPIRGVESEESYEDPDDANNADSTTNEIN